MAPSSTTVPTLVFPIPRSNDVATVAKSGKRLGARIIDNVVMAFSVGVAILAFARLHDVHLVLAWAASIAVIGAWTFVQGRLVVTRGQSIGKLALSLRIVRVDGDDPGFFRGFLARDAIIYSFSATQILGLLNGLAVLGSERRTLHDRILATVVLDLGTRRSRDLHVDDLVRTFG